MRDEIVCIGVVSKKICPIICLVLASGGLDKTAGSEDCWPWMIDN